MAACKPEVAIIIHWNKAFEKFQTLFLRLRGRATSHGLLLSLDMILCRPTSEMQTAAVKPEVSLVLQ